jgi:hypothetical protein
VPRQRKRFQVQAQLKNLTMGKSHLRVVLGAFSPGPAVDSNGLPLLEVKNVVRRR